MTVRDLSTLNAILNTVSAVLLLFGYVNIRARRIRAHKACMLSALVTSILFLTSYLIYHGLVGHVEYPYHDWTRPVYFAILIPHVMLAILMSPFILVMVWRALHGDFAEHRRLARWVWPVWIFVSISGVTVYLMLSR